MVKVSQRVRAGHAGALKGIPLAGFSPLQEILTRTQFPRLEASSDSQTKATRGKDAVCLVSVITSILSRRGSVTVSLPICLLVQRYHLISSL